MGNLKEVAYDLFQPSIEEEQENVSPSELSTAKREKLAVPDSAKQGRPITIESVRIDFPLKPYPAQVQMMSKIVHSLRRKENAVLESPTGSGKSLALLCATLAWRQKEEDMLIQKLLNNPKETPPPEVLKETNINKREREDVNNISNNSIDSDFQTQSRAEEKKPKYQDVSVTDMEDISFSISSAPASSAPVPSTPVQSAPKVKKESPRRRIPPNLIYKQSYKSSLDKFKLNNYTMDSYKSNNPPPAATSSSSTSPAPVKNERNSNLAYQTLREIPRIFVGSRTHKQITQLVQELKENTTYRPKMTILASREQLCVHPKVSKSSTKADDCNALLEKKKCIYALNTRRLVMHDDLKTSKRVWDIEDLVKLGSSPKLRACPYYASRKLYEGAEIIFCPYNYIIDPIIRAALDIQIKDSIVIIDEAHNIEDSSRSAGSFEVNENELKILAIELNQIVRGEYEPEAHNHMLYFTESLLEWMSDANNQFSIKEYEQHVNIWSGVQLLQRLEQLGIKATTFHGTIKPAFKSVYAHASKIRREAENDSINEGSNDAAAGEVQIHNRKCVSNNGLSVLQTLIMILGFFFEEGKSYSYDYRMALIKKIERGGTKKRRMNNKAKTKVSNDLVVDPSEWTYKLCFWCLNPGAIFRQLTDDTHSVILTSGTLAPMNTFESELETKFSSKLEANHVISPSQVWAGTIPVGPNNISLKGVYGNIESFQYQDDLGEALYQILDAVPFGVLCFFSSYGTLEKLTERWKLTGLMERMEKKKLALTEPRRSAKNEFEKMMKKYNEKISAVESDSDETGQTGALIFGVFRGKISEGIDFTDNTCRAVVSIGIPYPKLKDIQVNLKKTYNDQKKWAQPQSGILSGGEWYATQAYRAINQALGRCIRHRNDWGAIILLEERFMYQDNIDRLSKWIQKQHKSYPNFNMAIDSLTRFSSEHRHADAEARRALVENSVDQFLKTDEAKIPAATLPNAFDQLIDSTIPTTPANVTNTDTLVAHVTSPFPPLSQTPVATHPVPIESKSTKSITIVLSDDDDDEDKENEDILETKIKGLIEDEDYGINIDFGAINLDELPGGAASIQNQHNINNPALVTTAPLPVTPLPPPTPVSITSIHTPIIVETQLHSTVSIQNYNKAQVVELIKCNNCDNNLVSGFAKDRIITPNTKQLSFISHYSNTLDLIELNKPGSWIIQDKNLIGGPLGANVLPNKYKAEVDRNDRVCFRILTCKCEVNIGVVICEILEGGNKEYAGKVYLWQNAVHIITKKPMVVPHTRHFIDRENEYTTPSSQQTNMNDMFYNLP